jgi:hypothetical protein
VKIARTITWSLASSGCWPLSFWPNHARAASVLALSAPAVWRSGERRSGGPWRRQRAPRASPLRVCVMEVEAELGEVRLLRAHCMAMESRPVFGKNTRASDGGAG